MRKLAVALALSTTALATTAIATPANARDHSWYVGVEGGPMIVEDIHYDIGAVKSADTVNSKYGYDVDGVMGYDFGAFRLEAEVGYRHANVDTYQSTVATPFYTSTGLLAAAPAGDYHHVSGSNSALSFMVNALLDFGPDDGVQGFVGGGAGVARVKASNYALTNGGPFLDDSDTVFAWQGLAGIRAPISDHVDISLKYRFFNADNVKMYDIANQRYEGRFRSHSILGGLTYNFGAPPPPPPPPPPQTVQCSPGPFIVFFEWDKSNITPEAASILDNAITAYQSCGNAQVMLAGYTDTSGSAKYNMGLSQRRADSVKAYMVDHSIPEGVITTQAFGEDPAHLRVHTADGVREVQNRRVEITYGPGSGM